MDQPFKIIINYCLCSLLWLTWSRKIQINNQQLNFITMSDAKQMITEDQLKKIQDFQKDLNKLLNEVGFLEAQKSQVLGKFGEVNKETEDFKKELEKEYGSININLEDGSFTEIEKEKEEDKK
jgi:hypothetical protein